ncbi:23S rRNA (guanosine(2251)-2'-O)-methyltransferase RlmB [Lactobacillus sp. DCY120]|uniref:23S rRNA (Guanosine(2251)-2'-O)-methyltransferase RlmB n=1 Tax=Bombilactobacillus apium TaxID=2675299 RepID=A0A850R0V8_9LACO|nr:23S rRNA (guanosine(2251)-2'-O)-methyltransferase RlmB [Bombilactobacillus apium]NVY95990.1 23S rRNA (guanosine(2251)-2'-O)-methyltransferase RlmB [Bombilactobacillus apium]
MHTTSNKPERELVFGIYAVQALFQLPDVQQQVNKVFLQKNLPHNDKLQALLKTARRLHLIIQEVPKQKLDDLTQKENHQGIVVTVAPLRYWELPELLDHLTQSKETPFFLVLDNLNDPRNFGSILRTADAVGVNGVIIPKRRAASATGLVAKTSTGALARIPIVRVTNLVRTLQELKEAGIWVFGTAMQGSDYRQWDARGPIALVIGNEEKGLSPLVQKQMDATLTIPMVGEVQSLNASVATGILLYQAFTSREGDH